MYSLQCLKSPNLMTVELQNNLGDNIYIGTRWMCNQKSLDIDKHTLLVCPIHQNFWGHRL